MSESSEHPVEQQKPINPPAGMMEMWIRIPKPKQVMTIIILAITVLVYVIQLITQKVFQVDIPLNLFAMIPEMIYQGQFWRLITVVLVHGSILHIGLNMLAFFTLGRSLERFYGPWRILIIYLLGAIGGSSLSFLFFGPSGWRRGNWHICPGSCSTGSFPAQSLSLGTREPTISV